MENRSDEHLFSCVETGLNEPCFAILPGDPSFHGESVIY